MSAIIIISGVIIGFLAFGLLFKLFSLFFRAIIKIAAVIITVLFILTVLSAICGAIGYGIQFIVNFLN